MLTALGDRRLAPLVAAHVQADVAAPCERNSQGDTPLHIAAARGLASLIPAMLAGNPAPACCRDGQGRTPLHVAAAHGHTAVVECLMEATLGALGLGLPGWVSAAGHG